jgi:hypothetical protein
MSDAQVIRLVETPDTTDGVLLDAIERGLTSVLIMGYTPEGTLYLRSSTDMTRKDALWMMECAKPHVLGDDE